MHRPKGRFFHSRSAAHVDQGTPIQIYTSNRASTLFNMWFSGHHRHRKPGTGDSIMSTRICPGMPGKDAVNRKEQTKRTLPIPIPGAREAVRDRAAGSISRPNLESLGNHIPQTLLNPARRHKPRSKVFGLIASVPTSMCAIARTVCFKTIKQHMMGCRCCDRNECAAVQDLPAYHFCTCSKHLANRFRRAKFIVTLPRTQHGSLPSDTSRTTPPEVALD
ncbi:hypothetical protein QBC40DRAFT_87549 [Triangularia verruculosa]|uniref:Uncharacterized protein n=1 Tax=Triangularia verruculosa TaxID=2587418 RepID=A0AAN6XGS8_9PEZI|nr:hypothetical protein QBC40DRAFT_87549 [Triangularia verruculosa]